MFIRRWSLNAPIWRSSPPLDSKKYAVKKSRQSRSFSARRRAFIRSFDTGGNSVKADDFKDFQSLQSKVFRNTVPLFSDLLTQGVTLRKKRLLPMLFTAFQPLAHNRFAPIYSTILAFFDKSRHTNQNGRRDKPVCRLFIYLCGLISL